MATAQADPCSGEEPLIGKKKGPQGPFIISVVEELAVPGRIAELAEKCCVDHNNAAAVAAHAMIEQSSASNEKATADE